MNQVCTDGSMQWFLHGKADNIWTGSKYCNNDWSFKSEMIKYCRADVELLSKAVLSFRKMFKDKLDIDPFRYVTLASLCMAIFRGCFLPDKSIVANEQNKKVST